MASVHASAEGQSVPAQQPANPQPNNPKRCKEVISQLYRNFKRKSEALLNVSVEAVKAELEAELAQLQLQDNLSNQQLNRKRTLEQQKSHLVQPQLFCVYADPFGNIHPAIYSAGYTSDDFLNSAAKYLQQAVANHIERERLHARFREATSSPVDTLPGQATAECSGSRSKESNKLSKQLRKVFNDFFTQSLAERVTQAKQRLGDGAVVFCEQGSYAVCRRVDGVLHCGGACEQARLAMQWPDAHPCINPRGKGSSYLSKDLQGLLQHYKSLPQYEGCITLPEQPLERYAFITPVKYMLS